MRAKLLFDKAILSFFDLFFSPQNHINFKIITFTRLGYICFMWLEFLNVYNRTKQQQNPNFWVVTLAYPIFVTFIENMTLNTLTNTNLCNAVNSP